MHGVLSIWLSRHTHCKSIDLPAIPMHRDFFFARSWLYYGNVCSFGVAAAAAAAAAVAIVLCIETHTYTCATGYCNAAFTHVNSVFYSAYFVCELEQKVPIVGVSCNLNIFPQPLTAMRISCTLIITVQFACDDCGRTIVCAVLFLFLRSLFSPGYSNRPMSICISLHWNSQLLSFWTAKRAEDVSDARKIFFRCAQQLPYAIYISSTIVWAIYLCFIPAGSNKNECLAL